ncbi:MAG: alanine--tRNA ligase-related protein [Candidatus Thorarchaeota archaeon]
MTIKLYWKDPYQKEFKAEIIGLKKNGIILNQTLFYPLSGNQQNDKGILTIGELTINIENVSIEDDEIIHHIPLKSLNKIKIGDQVFGKIDWDYRYGLMKAHTSQHLFSALAKKNYDLDTVRANINFEDVSLHFSQELSYEQLKTTLQQLNLICTIDNRKISPKLLSNEEAKKKSNKIRGSIPKKDQIRIIETEYLDLVCCGGTHVQNSNEIGPVFLYEFKRGKEIKYYVGAKSLEKLSESNIKILEIANFIEDSVENIDQKFKKQAEEYISLQNQNKDQLIEILNLSKAYPKQITNGISIYLFDYMIDHKLIKKCFSDYPKNSVLLLFTDDKRLKIHSNNEKVNAEYILNSLIVKFGGKGGGNPKSAQGSLENRPLNLLSEINLILGQL